MIDALRLPRVLPHSRLPLSMADQPSESSAAAKKKGGRIMKLFRDAKDVIKRPKLANRSSQSNSTRVSVPSTSGTHDTVPENDAGSTEATPSSKFIGSILVLSTTTWPLPR